VTSLTVRRRVAAPVARLWDAWTSPAALRAWWGPPGVRCTDAEVDLRVGGAYRIANLQDDGSTVWIEGAFEVVEPPHRLVYTWRIGDEPTSRVTVTFAAVAGGAEIVVHHDRIATPAKRDGHEAGWLGCLDGLDAWLAVAG
jgi:uncharacterized protein YndB with AHSA1/START domain